MDEWKAAMGTVVGYTSGVFDLFHLGHLNRLRRAKDSCDELIVGVSTDECAQAYKDRLPVIPFAERIEIVRSLRAVDRVVPQTHLDKFLAWQVLQFHVLIHGDDEDQLKNLSPFKQALLDVGVRLVGHSRTPGLSTTQIICRVKTHLPGVALS